MQDDLFDKLTRLRQQIAVVNELLKYDQNTLVNRLNRIEGELQVLHEESLKNRCQPVFKIELQAPVQSCPTCGRSA
jgi:hypothetical protein